MNRVRCHSFLAVCALFAVVGDARAQTIAISGLSVDAQHELAGESMRGASIAVRSRAARVIYQLEVARTRAQSERIGSPCAGLVRPGTCPPEPLRDNTRMVSASGGAAFRVLRSQHLAVALTADLTATSMRADTRGLTSGGALSASRALFGAAVGARASWRPFVRVPLALELGVGIGTLMPLSDSQVVDGYTPFEKQFDARRMQVGLAWSPTWD